MPLLYIFIVIRRNYKRMILYEMLTNNVGKMSTKVYIEEILLAIRDDLLRHYLTL